MTYCLAWKKDGNIFMISDTAISSRTDELVADNNTFGEIQGLYDDYIVQEGLLKINKISDKEVLCFAGKVELADEIYSIYGYFERNRVYRKIKSY